MYAVNIGSFTMVFYSNKVIYNCKKRTHNLKSLIRTVAGIIEMLCNIAISDNKEPKYKTVGYFCIEHTSFCHTFMKFTLYVHFMYIFSISFLFSIIVDRTIPSLRCPGPVMVTAPPLQLYQRATWQEPMAEDNIDGTIQFVYLCIV